MGSTPTLRREHWRPSLLSAASGTVHNDAMERPNFQMTVGAMIGVVGCVALNIWLFRVGVFWGILCLNITKHVLIAGLCQAIGLDRSPAAEGPFIATGQSQLPGS